MSPFLFPMVMDELNRGIIVKVLWCMIFVNDTVLINETREWVSNKL